MSKTKRPPLLIREQFELIFLELSDAERGKLLSALMAYQWHSKQPRNLPDKLNGIFLVMKSFADSDNQKYIDKSEQNRRNIQTYWDKKRGIK